MAKQISFEYDNTTYTLKYTLRTVQQMEQAGFVLDELFTKPAIRIQELVYGAFIANHKGIKRKLVDEIYEQFKQKDELLRVLQEMYIDARDSLVDEGNLDWTASE